MKELWSRAKFIYIYRKLLPALALQPYDHIDIDRFILRTYRRMMEIYDRESKALPHSDQIEIRFEDLEEDPMGQSGESIKQWNRGDLKSPNPISKLS